MTALSMLLRLLALGLMIALFTMVRSRNPRIRLLADFMPASAPPPSWTSRIIETSALAYVSILAFVTIVLTRYERGLLTEPLPNAQSPITGLVVTVLFAAGILGALCLALTWRTWAAALLLVVLLVAYIFTTDPLTVRRISLQKSPPNRVTVSLSHEAMPSARVPTHPEAP